MRSSQPYARMVAPSMARWMRRRSSMSASRHAGSKTRLYVLVSPASRDSITSPRNPVQLIAQLPQLLCEPGQREGLEDIGQQPEPLELLDPGQPLVSGGHPGRDPRQLGVTGKCVGGRAGQPALRGVAGGHVRVEHDQRGVERAAVADRGGLPDQRAGRLQPRPGRRR